MIIELIHQGIKNYSVTFYVSETQKRPPFFQVVFWLDVSPIVVSPIVMRSAGFMVNKEAEFSC